MVCFFLETNSSIFYDAGFQHETRGQIMQREATLMQAVRRDEAKEALERKMLIAAGETPAVKVHDTPAIVEGGGKGSGVVKQWDIGLLRVGKPHADHCTEFDQCVHGDSECGVFLRKHGFGMDLSSGTRLGSGSTGVVFGGYVDTGVWIGNGCGNGIGNGGAFVVKRCQFKGLRARTLFTQEVDLMKSLSDYVWFPKVFCVIWFVCEQHCGARRELFTRFSYCKRDATKKDKVESLSFGSVIMSSVSGHGDSGMIEGCDLECLEWLLRNIFGALKCLASKGICHGDVKHANLVHNYETREFLLIDFSHSTHTSQQGKYVRGTEGFNAPEVMEKSGQKHRGDCGLKSDVFSTGVLMMHYVCGKQSMKDYYPDFSNYCKECSSKQQYKPFFKGILVKEKFSAEKQTITSLLEQCLAVCPLQRITAATALDHEFFRSDKVVSIK